MKGEVTAQHCFRCCGGGEFKKSNEINAENIKICIAKFSV
jgi:hypothetical protein